MFKNNKKKGLKIYGLMQSEGAIVIGSNKDIEITKRHLDSNWPILVELTVTRVFTRERDLVEIETEI